MPKGERSDGYVQQINFIPKFHHPLPPFPSINHAPTPNLMPRLPHSLLHKAYNQSQLLPYLLRATRDLTLARYELIWLQQYTLRISHIHASRPPDLHHKSRRTRRKQTSPPPSLVELCKLRSTGLPLQYILGSQPFCDVEVLCGRGVLVPRYAHPYQPSGKNPTPIRFKPVVKHGVLIRVDLI